MKVFILEDDPQRMELFHEVLRDHDVVRVDNVADAVRKFKPPYDVICLDHDLGGQVYVPSDHENTGYQFAKHLASNERCGNQQVVVHSWNMVGARRMVDTLKRVGWTVAAEPFGPTLLNALKAMETQNATP